MSLETELEEMLEIWEKSLKAKEEYLAEESDYFTKGEADQLVICIGYLKGILIDRYGYKDK